MNTHADKTPENKSQAVAKSLSKQQRSDKLTFQFVDNRPEAIAQKEWQEMANTSPQVKQLKAFQEMANNSPRAQKTAQLQSMINSRSSPPIQKQGIEEEGPIKQKKEKAVTQFFHGVLNQPPLHNPIQKKENNTGLPDTLKTGMENLSGMSLDDVKVHYNSDKPAQLQAQAYAQGTDIHVGTGQEKHLPHEAWHVVQQKQGRVKPTLQMKGTVNVNNDIGLEKEADMMGDKAAAKNNTSYFSQHNTLAAASSINSTIQRRLTINNENKNSGDLKTEYGEYKGSEWFDMLDSWINLPGGKDHPFNSWAEAKAKAESILSEQRQMPDGIGILEKDMESWMSMYGYNTPDGFVEAGALRSYAIRYEDGLVDYHISVSYGSGIVKSMHYAVRSLKEGSTKNDVKYCWYRVIEDGKGGYSLQNIGEAGRGGELLNTVIAETGIDIANNDILTACIKDLSDWGKISSEHGKKQPKKERKK